MYSPSQSLKTNILFGQYYCVASHLSPYIEPIQTNTKFPKTCTNLLGA